MWLKFCSLLLGLGLALILGGCELVSISDQTQHSHRGRLVPDDLLEKFTLGTTTQYQIQNVLGEPDVWDISTQKATYYLTEHTNHRTRILLLFGYKHEGTSAAELSIRYTNGILRDYTLFPSDSVPSTRRPMVPRTH